VRAALKSAQSGILEVCLRFGTGRREFFRIAAAIQGAPIARMVG
jgi:hypothetical protein